MINLTKPHACAYSQVALVNGTSGRGFNKTVQRLSIPLTHLNFLDDLLLNNPFRALNLLLLLDLLLLDLWRRGRGRGGLESIRRMAGSAKQGIAVGQLTAVNACGVCLASTVVWCFWVEMPSHDTHTYRARAARGVGVGVGVPWCALNGWLHRLVQGRM
jgi:hypothetical protein